MNIIIVVQNLDISPYIQIESFSRATKLLDLFEEWDRKMGDYHLEN